MCPHDPKLVYSETPRFLWIPKRPIREIMCFELTQVLLFKLSFKTLDRSELIALLSWCRICYLQKPQWQPAAVEDVKHEEVQGIFSPVEGHPPPFWDFYRRWQSAILQIAFEQSLAGLRISKQSLSLFWKISSGDTRSFQSEEAYAVDLASSSKLDTSSLRMCHKFDILFYTLYETGPCSLNG